MDDEMDTIIDLRIKYAKTDDERAVLVLQRLCKHHLNMEFSLSGTMLVCEHCGFSVLTGQGTGKPYYGKR
jgi:hypothetical protein